MIVADGGLERWLLNTRRETLNLSSTEQRSRSRVPRCPFFSLGGKKPLFNYQSNFVLFFFFCGPQTRRLTFLISEVLGYVFGTTNNLHFSWTSPPPAAANKSRTLTQLSAPTNASFLAAVNKSPKFHVIVIMFR